jgi:hypothetical protein
MLVILSLFWSRQTSKISASNPQDYQSIMSICSLHQRNQVGKSIRRKKVEKAKRESLKRKLKEKASRKSQRESW